MEGPRASKGRQMKSHTKIKLFNTEGLLRSQYNKKIYLGKMSCTLYWSLGGIFCYFFLLVFWHSQVLNPEQRLWFFYWCKGNKHCNPMLHHIPVSLISSLVQARLCLQAGLQLPEPSEWEGQQRRCRVTTIRWKCDSGAIPRSPFRSLSCRRSRAPHTALLPCWSPSCRGWDVTSGNICRLLTTPSHTPQSFQHTHESKLSYFFFKALKE